MILSGNKPRREIIIMRATIKRFNDQQDDDDETYNKIELEKL